MLLLPRAATVACLVLALACPLTARGQQPAPGTTTTPAAAPGAAAPEARELIRRGNDLYRLSKFEEALVLYEKAYELDQRPSTLFNVAQCHRQLKRFDRALFLYRQYLRSNPPAAHRAIVDGIIAQMEQQARQEAPATPGTATSSGPDAPTAAPLLPRADAATPAAAAAAGSASAVPASRPWYRRWYVWTAVALVIAGGAVGGAVAATRGSGVPTTVYGDHTFFAAGGR
jgi:tetratricopeptide (TPR) repeat protein